MEFAKIDLAPGINRETTDYSNSGGWFDCDKIRFRNGKPEKIGGWVKHTDTAVDGVVRGIRVFTALNGTIYIGLGTEKRFYISDSGILNDITPLRSSNTLSNPIDTSSGSTTVTVNQTTHGADIGDLVEISGSTSVGGIPDTEINAVHVITSVPTSGTFTFEVSTSATSTVSGGGGASVQVDHYIKSGLNSAVTGTGWGAGPWGDGGWGEASSTSVDAGNLRVWSIASYGEDIVICPRNNSIFYWDVSNGTGTRAVDIDTLAGAADAPSVAIKVIVSDRDRHVIALGCDSIATPGTQDPMLVRWSNQESASDWSQSASTTAGEILLSYGSRIITGIPTRQEILIWTDKALYAMRYIGGLYTFGITPISDKMSIIGFNAAAAVGDRVFWMGFDSFYTYDGQSRSLPCSVEDYVFSDINTQQYDKVYAGSNADDKEIIWLYPSASSEEVDRYVIYNYMDNIWYFGSLDRTTWQDSGPLTYPIASSTDGFIYEHENGIEDGSTNPPSKISSYIESSPMEIDAGSRFVFIKRLIPDITFNRSTDSQPDVNFTFKVRNAPGASTLDANVAKVRTKTTTITQFDEEKWLRLRGRSFVMRVSDTDNNKTGVQWRLGSPRVEIRTDGRR